MEMIRIKGVRRVGNNFIMETIRANLDIKVNSGPHRAHKPIINYESEDGKLQHTLYFVIIIKNPYSWCLSITSWAKKAWGPTWSSATWDKDWYMWEKLYEGYNNFYRICFDFYSEYTVPSFIIRYEDFLKDPEEKLNLISKECDIKFKSDELVIPDKVPQSEKFSEEKKKFYLSGGTFGLDKKLVEKINKCVDWELMSYYGYRRSDS